MAENTVKMAVIGVGIMGTSHVRDIVDLPQCEVVAVCDIDPVALDKITKIVDVPTYTDYNDLLADSDNFDAVVIATPHYDHTTISLAAFEKGVHVLVEKPIAVHAKDAQKMIDAYNKALETYPDLKFGAIFMQRTYGYWQKIKSMIDGGELGNLIRTTWIITSWFRTQYYYDMGGWRATWEGEGGGVLLNQCPHNLDLYQWLVGLPSRVRGFVTFGKYHNIEVEDEVTGYFEHANGMVGHFITTTAESPGTNRLEIVGELGRLVYEDDVLTFYKNEWSSAKQLKEADQGFAKVPFEKVTVEYEHHGQPGHKFIIENFANAVIDDVPLIAQAVEGINSVMLGNAIILSSVQNTTVDLPIDGDAYESLLRDLIAEAAQ